MVHEELTEKIIGCAFKGFKYLGVWVSGEGV